MRPILSTMVCHFGCLTWVTIQGLGCQAVLWNLSFENSVSRWAPKHWGACCTTMPGGDSVWHRHEKCCEIFKQLIYHAHYHGLWTPAHSRLDYGPVIKSFFLTTKVTSFSYYKKPKPNWALQEAFHTTSARGKHWGRDCVLLSHHFPSSILTPVCSFLHINQQFTQWDNSVK